MARFDVAEAQLVALFTETILYGLFLATFGECLRALLWLGDAFRATANVKWTLLVVACAMAINGTVDVALNFQHNHHAFILYSGPGGAVGEFSILSNWINVARGITWAIQAIIGDAILVYRVHIIWGRTWLVTALPLLLWLGVSVASSAIPYLEARVDGEALLTINELNAWTNATIALTLALNILGTALISYRVWRVSRCTPAVSEHATDNTDLGHPLSYALRIIIESGTLYTLSAVALFITSVLKSNAIYAVSDSLTQIIGICFNLIIVRVNWHSEAAAAAAAGGCGGQGPVTFATASRLNGHSSIPLHFVTQSATGDASPGGSTLGSSVLPLHIAIPKDVELEGGPTSATKEYVDGEAVEGSWSR